MSLKHMRITYKHIFCAALFVLLTSRILVLTENYSWPVDPVLIEIVYLFAVAIIMLLSRKGRLKVPLGKHLYVLLILMVHTVLWGTVFVDKSFDDLIFTHFQSQIMFVFIILVTVWAVYQLNAELSFLRCCYFTMSSILFVHLALHFSDLNLSNIANIMSVAERTRANFGFGHYNTLGMACVCNILLREMLRKEKDGLSIFRIFDIPVLLMSVCMLLCSASRSAITSLIVYFVIYYSQKLDDLRIGKKFILLIKILLALFVGILILWVLLEVDFSSLLVLAQRSHMFTRSLPMFFETGQIWLGLGYASNVAYAEGLTPYTTYWLDNAYIYFLITTGIIGCALLLSAFITIFWGISSKRKLPLGKEVFAVFAVYAYISLFEAVMFTSGGLVNYIYLPWFLNHIMRKGQPHPAQTGPSTEYFSQQSLQGPSQCHFHS